MLRRLRRWLPWLRPERGAVASRPRADLGADLGAGLGVGLVQTRARLELPLDKLVVGLGNPGPDYARSRHNAGFRVVDAWATALGAELSDERYLGRYGVAELDGRAVGLLEPQTFMNASGDALGAVLEAHPQLDPGRDLVVVYDELDLPFGRIRLRAGGGAGGHRGMGHVLERVGRRDVARLRFGVGRPAEGETVLDHVLGEFSPSEAAALPDRIAAACGALSLCLEEGVGIAMDRFNRDPGGG